MLRRLHNLILQNVLQLVLKRPGQKLCCVKEQVSFVTQQNKAALLMSQQKNYKAHKNICNTTML